MTQNRIFIIFLTILVGGFIWYLIDGTDSSETKKPNIQEIGASFTKGNIDVPVTIRQYSDFLCPSCSQISLGVVPEIMKQYVDSGKARYEFIPMAFIAQGSQLAAEGAFCAAKNNKFWEYHDVAYQSVWTNYFSKGVDPSRVFLYSPDGVKQLGAVAGVDQASFDSCIDNREERAAVVAVTEQAQASGVTGTPYFVINDTPIKGVPSYEILDAAIKAQL